MCGVTGNPARREANLCKLNTLEHEDGRTVLFRGPATEGTSSYTPSAAMLAFAPGNRTPSAAQDAQSDVLAVGSSAAKTRVIVPVPTEGMFGYWSAFPGGVVGVAGYRSRQVQFNSQLPVPTPYLAPDYKPEGAALAARYDESFDNPALGCESSVLDGIFHHGNINEFVQVNAQQIRWVYGYMDLVRTIHMGEHQIPEGTQPSTLGYSTGHWEGDTLVVRTGALKKQWLYDTENHADYVVASNQLQIEERITHDPDNDHLVIEYTATDPAFWTSPISGVLRLARSDTPYQAYNCVELAGENNRRPDGSTVFD